MIPIIIERKKIYHPTLVFLLDGKLALTTTRMAVAVTTTRRVRFVRLSFRELKETFCIARFDGCLEIGTIFGALFVFGA